MSFLKRWLKRFIDVHYGTVQRWLNDQKDPVDQEYLKGYDDGKNSRLFAHNRTAGDFGRDMKRAYDKGYTDGREVWINERIARRAAERAERQSFAKLERQRKRYNS